MTPAWPGPGTFVLAGPSSIPGVIIDAMGGLYRVQHVTPQEGYPYKVWWGPEALTPDFEHREEVKDNVQPDCNRGGCLLRSNWVDAEANGAVR